MDKVRIEYKEGTYSYILRIPNDYDWFELMRYENSTKEGFINLIYNGGKINILENKGTISDLVNDPHKKMRIVEEFIKSLIIYTHFSNDSLEIAKRLGVEISDLDISDINYTTEKDSNEKIIIKINSPFDDNINGILMYNDKIVEMDNKLYYDIITLIGTYLSNEIAQNKMPKRKYSNTNKKILNMKDYKKGR